MRRVSILLFSVLLGISGCGKDLPPVPEPSSRPAKLFMVSVGNNQYQRDFPATTEAGDRAVLAFRVPGQLDNILVQAGQQVSKGEVLATLNPDEYSVLKKQASAQFRLAEVQYLRMKKLRKSQVVSEQDFDQAQADYKSARSFLDQAEANLRYTKLTAPYDGTISLVPAEVFEYLPANEAVMNIQSNQILKVIFQLPEHLLTRYSSRARATSTMQFDALPETSFPLEFQEIDTEADPSTGAYKVTMVMARPQGIGILPGMAGTITATAAKGKATEVPLSALFEQDGETCVWRVADDGIVSKVPVNLDEKRHVISGLEDGDRIVISGVSDITSGIRVREWIKERGL
ncbi:efflux transporter periplasmic adaptor subunit [Vibrio sp. 10N.286.49.B3]|uniref:efflux RND transporter periplasmic adaptor subunit n=1 Tax=Vibrio sp. 10N.286.49.B3 TaxID=1880855 RepID=UPI000C84AEF5|nr:efflux RND transporter periplasmic adaptor subunit [Vibrio sp. 10N.286.49.B3]PMH46720.1 efflux transporter periplasmic adaptor subunit [Vibrio sp. 10N.286.49.B3]